MRGGTTTRLDVCVVARRDDRYDARRIVRGGTTTTLNARVVARRDDGFDARRIVKGGTTTTFDVCVVARHAPLLSQVRRVRAPAPTKTGDRGD